MSYAPTKKQVIDALARGVVSLKIDIEKVDPLFLTATIKTVTGMKFKNKALYTKVIKWALEQAKNKKEAV